MKVLVSVDSTTQVKGHSSCSIAGVLNRYCSSLLATSLAVLLLSCATLSHAAELIFESASNFVLTVKRVHPLPVTEVATIQSQQTRTLPVELGEVYSIETPDAAYRHRNVFINNLDRERVVLRPRKSLDDDDQLFLKENPPLDVEANLRSYDIRTFDPGSVGASSSKPIFQGIDLGVGANNYELLGSNRLLPTGFDYAGSDNVYRGRRKSTEIYGYSSLVKEWNVNASVTVPVKAVNVTGGFGYGEKKTDVSSQRDVFYFSDASVNSYTVKTLPVLALVRPAFVNAVAAVTDADTARHFVDTYGTHYASNMEYGARRSAYVKISERQYQKVQESNLDVKLAIDSQLQGTKETKTTAGVETEKESKSGSHGSVAVSQSTSQEVRDVLKTSESYYYAYGGDGNLSGEFTAEESNAVPIKADLKPIDQLITPEVFKNRFTAADLAPKKKLIEDQITKVVNDCLTGKDANCRYQALNEVPQQRGFRFRLKGIKVVDEVDDLSREIKGYVSLMVSTGNGSPKRYDVWSSNGGYAPDPRAQWATPSANWYELKQIPDANGNYAPVKLNLFARLIDNDGVVSHECFDRTPAWCDDVIVLHNNIVRIDEIDGPTDFEFTMSHRASDWEKTKLKVVVQVMPLPLPGNTRFAVLNTNRSTNIPAGKAKVSFQLPPGLRGDATALAASSQPAVVQTITTKPEYGYVRLENHWKRGLYINNQTGTLALGAAKPSWWSAQWGMHQRRTQSGGVQVKIYNRWTNDKFLHVQHGSLELGPVGDGWLSAWWDVEFVTDRRVRLRNAWATEKYIHNQNGLLEAGPAAAGWWSAQWHW